MRSVPLDPTHALLLPVIAVALVVIRKLLRQYVRWSSNEPLLFPGAPFLGHAVAFGTDYLHLLRRLFKAADGAPMITVRAKPMAPQPFTAPKGM